MLTRLRHLIVRTAALGALLVLLAGPMLLVAHLAGRPLPTGDQLRRAWHGGDLDWHVAAKLAAAGFWLLWGYLTAITVTEAARVLRGRAPGVTHRRHVGAFGLTTVVRYLVRTTLAAGITVTTIIPIAASVAARPAIPAAALAATTPAPSGVVAVDASVSDASTATVIASGRDTPYSIAVRCCHDPTIRTTILELNRGRPLPDGSRYDGGTFPAGWNVLIPADGSTSAAAVGATDDREYPVPIPVGEHVVERGDNLWTIAKHHLQDAGLPAPTERQVADYWHTTISDNQPHLTSGNPNLIYPGEDVTLPAAGPQPDDTTVPPTVVPAPVDIAPPPPTVLPSTPLPPPTTAPSMTTTAPTTVPASTSPTTPPTIAAPTRMPSASPPINQARDEHARQLAVWTGGTVLATGTILAVARARRRRLATGRQPPHQHAGPGQRDLELALRATSQPDQLAWAATVLRDLGARFKPQQGQPQPACVQLTDDAIDVLWNTPAPDPPLQWRTGDAGWSWHRDRHPNDPTTSDRTGPCPTLVTIGTRPDNPNATVLLHLETAGTLHLPNEPAMTDVARALVHELATTPFADDIDILITDPAHTPPAAPDRVRTATLDDAITWAEARTADTNDNLRRRHHDNVFAARLTNTSLDGYQPVVIVATATGHNPELLDRLVAACQPGTGATAIIVGGPTQPWNLTLASGRLHVAPLGFDLNPITLTAPDADRLNTLLGDASAEGTEDDLSTIDVGADVVLADEPIDLTTITEPDDADEPIDVTTPEPDDTDEPDAFADAPFDVQVHVLGQVHATGASQHLTPGEVELLAYLVFHPDGETADTIMTQLWPTQPAAPKTYRNRCTNLRTKLGTGRDRQLLFPESRDTGLYRTSPLVTSDLDRFRGRVHHAESAPSGEAIDLLKQALELVTGPPFRTTGGYDWAYAEQVEDRANHDIQHAACWLAELALEAEDPHTALWAAAQAKLALGVLAAEPLGRLEMLAHAHDGNTAAITDVYRELQAALERDDPATDLATETVALYQRLVSDRSTGRASSA